MITKVNNKWNVEYQGLPLFMGVSFWSNTTSGLQSLSLEELSPEAGQIWKGRLSNVEAGIMGELAVKEKNGTWLFDVELAIEQKELTQVLDFAAKNCFMISVEKIGDMQQCVAGAMGSNLWWMTPHFLEDIKAIPERTQNLLTKEKDSYTAYLPMPIEKAVTELQGSNEGLHLGCSLYREGATRIAGQFLAIRTEKNPYTCMEQIYKDAIPARFLLRKEREYPERMKYFGFCSWDAFYTDVTAAGIEEKLQEFREKEIPIHWVLIDDGWMQTKERKLCSFKEDRNKFPEGLKGFVEKIKREYGVQKVGVWHSLQGYWHGIEPDSDLYHKQKHNLIETAAGYVLPAWEEEKAFEFWNTWHTYLKNQGIDFVKVDNQGGSSEYARNNVPRASAARNILRALETSVISNFDGDILHCMGMGEAEYLARRVTGVSRSSDDFYPTRLDGFRIHVLQNAYNSFFHGPIYWCDWDMWWTKHPTATQSAVLRAISGGPIYVSDKVGETESSQLLPLMEADGRLLRCDAPGRPILSQLMGITEDKICQLWNTCNGNPVVAAFDLDDCTSTDKVTICCGEVIFDDREYVAYAALAKKYYKVKKEGFLEIQLTDGAEIVNFYPVEQDSILMGDPEKYVSMASRKKIRKVLSEIEFAEGD